MKKRPLPVWVFISILAAAIGSWWLAERGGIEVEPPRPARDPRAPDYYVKDLSATTMTLDGQPARTLNAPQMQHFSKRDLTELETPEFVIYQDQGEPWRIHAERGQISADGEILLLLGEVIIENAGNGEQRPLRLLTRDLRIQPERDYAETDEAISVSSNGDRIEAVGMQAWLRDPVKLKFLSRVRGQYVPR